MVTVNILVWSGHETSLRERNRGGDTELVCECDCGWRGPSYPENDEYTAVDSLRIHRMTAPDLPGKFVVLLRQPVGEIT